MIFLFICLYYILNIGLIIPSPTSAESKANIPKPITTIPADLKNRSLYFDFANDIDPKDKRNNIGKVPRAKKNIIIDPFMKD